LNLFEQYFSIISAILFYYYLFYYFYFQNLDLEF